MVGRPFEPGKSGNPRGRPKQGDDIRDVKELARKYTKEAVERLGFWMRQDNAKASVSAAALLLDRAWGKAEQTVTHEQRDSEDWTREQLIARLEQSDARNGGNGTAPTNGRGGGPDSVH